MDRLETVAFGVALDADDAHLHLAPGRKLPVRAIGVVLGSASAIHVSSNLCCRTCCSFHLFTWERYSRARSSSSTASLYAEVLFRYATRPERPARDQSPRSVVQSGTLSVWSHTWLENPSALGLQCLDVVLLHCLLIDHVCSVNDEMVLRELHLGRSAGLARFLGVNVLSGLGDPLLQRIALQLVALVPLALPVASWVITTRPLSTSCSRP